MCRSQAEVSFSLPWRVSIRLDDSDILCSRVWRVDRYSIEWDPRTAVASILVFLCTNQGTLVRNIENHRSYRFFSVTEQWLCLIPAVSSRICGVLEMIISFVTLLINKNRSFCYKAKHTHTRNHIKKLEYLELAKSHFDETAPGGITSQWLSVRLCLVGPLMHYETEKWMISIVRARRFIPYFAKSIESGAMERTIEGFLQGIVSNQCF